MGYIESVSEDWDSPDDDITEELKEYKEWEEVSDKYDSLVKQYKNKFKIKYDPLDKQ